MINSVVPVAISVCSLAASLFAVELECLAQQSDWPQWRGPNRDGYAAEQTLLQSWPAGGPALSWEFAGAGRGYSGVAVAGGRLYTMGARDDACLAICVDATTGEQKWERKVSRASTNDDYLHGWGGGPRATPTVDRNQVFVLTDIGVLAALNADDGKLQWATNLVKDHGGSIPTWGYSESVLVDDNRVVATAGGPNFMIAIDRATGEKVWTSQDFDEPAQYVSIVKAVVAGEPPLSLYITACKTGLVGFATESGKLLFSDSSTGNSTAVIPTPVFSDGQLFHTSNYGAGNTLWKLSTNDAGELDTELIYHKEGKTMQNHHGGVVLVDGVVYGFSKVSGGTWMAQDLAGGEVLWSESFGKNRSGSICFADGRLYCFNSKDGSVLLVEPNREQLQIVGELTISRETELERNKGAIWTHPVIAEQTLFLRDQNLIFAYDIARE